MCTDYGRSFWDEREIILREHAQITHIMASLRTEAARTGGREGTTGAHAVDAEAPEDSHTSSARMEEEEQSPSIDMRGDDITQAAAVLMTLENENIARPRSPTARDDFSSASADSRSIAARYGDEKVANREIRVWHGATENGP